MRVVIVLALTFVANLRLYSQVDSSLASDSSVINLELNDTLSRSTDSKTIYDPKKFKAAYDKALHDLYDQNYKKALSEFIDLEKMQPDNHNIHFLIGFCFVHATENFKDAITYLEKAKTKMTKKYDEHSYKQKEAPFETLKYLGDAYHMEYQFEKAIDNYLEFKAHIHGKAYEQRQHIQRHISQCETAIDLMQHPLNIKIENVGDHINTEYEDYAPVVNADETIMIFTSKRPHETGHKHELTGELYEDIFISHKVDGEWQDPDILSKSIHSKDHEASKFLSADGQTLLMYKYDETGNGDIFMSRFLNGVWSEPTRLGGGVNTPYWEGHASMTPDEQLIFFSSDRPGGFGGKDIYYCKKMPDGTWGEAIDCSEIINSPLNDDAPYIHPDGFTMFFSSEAHHGMGGYDIFVTHLSESGVWDVPENIGYPINTTGNDVFFYPSADGKRAYYASHHRDRRADHDVYEIYFEERQTHALTVCKGHIEGNSQDVIIEVDNLKTDKLVGIYRPDTKSGDYLMVLEPGNDYLLNYKHGNEVFSTENLSVPINVGSIISLDSLKKDQHKILRRKDSLSEKRQVQIEEKEIENNPTMNGLTSYEDTENEFVSVVDLTNLSDTAVTDTASNEMFALSISDQNHKPISTQFRLLNNKTGEVLYSGLSENGFAKIPRSMDSLTSDSNVVVVIGMDQPEEIESISIVEWKEGHKPTFNVDSGKSVVDNSPYGESVDFNYKALISDTANLLSVRLTNGSESISEDIQVVLFDTMSMDTLFKVLAKNGFARFPISKEQISSNKNLMVRAFDGTRSISIPALNLLDSDSAFIDLAVNPIGNETIVLDILDDSGKPLEDAHVFVYDKRTGKQLYDVNAKNGKADLAITSEHANDKEFLEVRVSNMGYYAKPMPIKELNQEGSSLKMKKLSNEFIIKAQTTQGHSMLGIKGVEITVLDIDTKDILFTGKTNEDGYLDLVLDREELYGNLNVEIHLFHHDYIGKPLEIRERLKDFEYYELLGDKRISMEKVETGKDMAKMLSLDPIYFELNKATLQEIAKSELDIIAEVLRDHSQIIIELASHTDSRGSNDFNYRLSEDRAKSAMKYLVSKGVNSKQIQSKGYGETKPLNECIDGFDCDEAKHAKNRRVEFNIVEIH
ncbi:MAG: OmpA family protein [Flavobacteriales bacterium]|nr:OmpA family protein [Flavobacteriales bacterium]